MNPIDTQKHQTLSAMITNEAKETIVRSEDDEMFIGKYVLYLLVCCAL